MSYSITDYCISGYLRIRDSLKSVLMLHWALLDVTNYAAAGNVHEFLGFAKFSNISTSRTFPPIQHVLTEINYTKYD